MEDINQQLHEAALRGKLQSVKKLLKEGSNINQKDQDGKTPLYMAVLHGQQNVIEYLINHGADVEKATPDGQTPLHLAASLGRLKATKVILSHGASMDKEDKDGRSALYIAARYGKLDVTQHLVSRGAESNRGDNDGRTALHLASQEGNLNVTKYLISQGVEVNKGDKYGRTAFHLAANNGHLAVIKYLISQGAEVNRGDNDGKTALHLAATKGNLDVTKYLISQGAEVNKYDNDGKTVLRSAASGGRLDVTKYLISEEAEVNRGDKDGVTALHIAAIMGHLDVTKYLINQKAEVNTRDNDGRTAFHLASRGGFLDVTKYLISQGAEVNKEDNEGWTALHNAAFSGHNDVTKYLIIQGAEMKGDNDGLTAMHLAASVGQFDVIQYLISQGAVVNRGENDGWTALHHAAFSGHFEVVQYLIFQGAEVKKGDNNGKTALHIAAHKGHLEVTKCLIGQGAEVNKGDHDGRTALHLASQEGFVDVIKYLISQGAEVNKGDNGGWTALHRAAFSGHFEVIQYLIIQGAEVKKGDNDGKTAFHLAADKGHLEVTKCLIGQGAEVNREDNDGRTALHHAIQNGYLDVVKVLMTGGARFDIGDIHGQTPLHLSLILGYERIADLFNDRSDSKLDQNYLTDIRLAIQCGHTSTIEKLVSGGADLNIQSADGQTCLHTAIKLCYDSEKVIQETDSLRKISDEYYRGELSPKRALVFYLLKNGAKLDVKDERGNLPIQYAKDEVVKQMILSRLPSLEEIKSYRRERPSTPAIVSVEVKRNTSQEIDLEDHGVSLFIPPEAVHQDDPCKITLTLLRDPPSVDIQDDESVACYGIRCDPPNMIFHKPVKIRIPHSTLAINPDQVKPDIVSHVWDPVNDLPRTSRKRTSSSPDEPPYCKMYRRHLELYIGHCADWWVLIPLEHQVIRHQLMCTPYIPDTIERGKEIEVHLHVHANLPGMDTDVQEEEKEQSYHKVHPSIPISIATKSDDVQVTCYRQCEIEHRKVLPLKDVQSKMKHSIVLTVPPREEDTDFPVTITIAQAGKVGVSISLAFVIRYTDELKYEPFLEPASFARVADEVSRSDFKDIDVHTIAEKMTVDQFYDLGVALGFRIQQLDVIEYGRFRDRKQAIYDMLVTWRQAQASGQEAKETLLSLMRSLDSPAEEMELTDIGSTGEVLDKTLLVFARKIKSEQFFEIGGKLGLNMTELEHIQHRTLSNRKDANIQMLSKWKASQTSGNQAIQTLQLVWKSVQAVPKTENLEDDGSSREIEQTPAEKTKPREPSCEPEEMEIIRTSNVGDVSSGTSEECAESLQNLYRHGGVPDTEELSLVACRVKSLQLVCSLGKALRLNDDLIFGLIDLPSSSILHTITRELVDIWWNGLILEEREDQLAKLLSEYKSQDVKTVSTGREEISKVITSKKDLLDLCHRLNIKPSSVLQIMCTSVTFPSHIIHRLYGSALKMLKEWVHQGGTRERLLEVAQAFRFNDAAVEIAEAMEYQPSNMPFISHSIIDHKGGELTVGELGITVSIPEGAIPKRMRRSVVTLRVPTHGTPRIPVREGEIVITPVIECSLTQELLKPATVVLPHCTNHNERKDDSCVILYTKTGPVSFGRMNLTPRKSTISKDKIEFHTRHLQAWAVSSTDLQGIQLKCVVFQPLCMTHAEKPTIRVYILHPYRNYVKDITKNEKSLPVPYCQVPKEFRFCVESKSGDLKVLLDIGTKRNERTMPIKSTLSGKCNPLSFELEFSPEEKGKKNVHLEILHGSATLAEREYNISIEDEPDYAVDHTDSKGGLQYVSNDLLEILADVIHTPKELKSLGYQLGFSSSSMEKYNEQADVSFDSVSRSGFGEMLRDWRRKVRPSEQVDELYLALHNAGLGHTAEVIIHGLSITSKKRFAQVREKWESAKK